MACGKTVGVRAAETKADMEGSGESGRGSCGHRVVVGWKASRLGGDRKKGWIGWIWNMEFWLLALRVG